jgi:hypothetical protein
MVVRVSRDAEQNGVSGDAEQNGVLESQNKFNL